jgi:HK97 family phage major capsid protein
MNHVESNASEILLHGSLTDNSDLAARHAVTGGTAEYYRTLQKERRHATRLDDLLCLPVEERRNFSITALAASMLQDGKGRGTFERDVDAFVAQRTGQVAHGAWVPLGLLGRDFNAGTAGEAGNLVATARMGDVAGDPLRPVTVLGGLPVTLLHALKSSTSVPLFNSASAAAIVSETGAATEILTTTESADLTPFTLRVIAVFSRAALIQSTPSLEKAFSRQLSAALFSGLERLVLAGSGADGEPTGIVRRDDVNVIPAGDDGAALAWAHLAAMEKGAIAANVAPTGGAFVVNPKVSHAMRTTPRGSNLDFLMPSDSALGYCR